MNIDLTIKFGEIRFRLFSHIFIDDVGVLIPKNDILDEYPQKWHGVLDLELSRPTIRIRFLSTSKFHIPDCDIFQNGVDDEEPRGL